MHATELTQRVCDGHVPEIAERLGTNRSWVYKICSDPDHDYYSRFRRFLEVLETVNPEGVDLLIGDLIAWRRAQRAPQQFSGDWLEALGKVMLVTQEALTAGLAGPGAEFSEKANLAIGSLAYLMAMGHCPIDETQ